jgi:hypothetical protein
LVFLLATCTYPRKYTLEIDENHPDINVKEQLTHLPSDSGIYAYGIVDVYTTSLATFTIENTGSDTLIIQSTYTLGDDVLQFIIDTSSTSSVIEPGDSTTLTIFYKPTNTDNHNVDVVIESNDPDEGVYQFTLTGGGNGPYSDLPEINIRQGSLDIYDETGMYDFGVKEAWTLNSVQFSVDNTGTSDLYIHSILLSSGTTDAFAIIAPSIPGNITPSSSIDFTVTFSPEPSGIYYVEILIVNDDPDEGIYTFEISGQGTAAPVPDIELRRDLIDIPSGTGSHNFGLVEVGNSMSATFTIENTGTAALSINGVTINDITSGPGDFVITDLSVPLYVNPGTSNNFNVSFSSFSPLGEKVAVIELLNNDPDESTFSFTVSGTTVEGTSVCDINITHGLTGVNIPSGSLGHDFSAVGVGASISVYFNIWNTGTETLNLEGIGISGNGSEFSIDSSLLEMTVLPNNNTTIGIIFSPTSYGEKSFSIIIMSDDPDESSYLITVIGTGTTSSEPDISVMIGSVEYVNGTSYDYGNAEVNFGVLDDDDFVSRIFTIKNIGTDNLNVTDVLFLGGQAGDFSHDLSVPLTIQPGNNTNFTVVFTPGYFGTRSTKLQIKSNDIDESPYQITLRGNGIEDDDN